MKQAGLKTALSAAVVLGSVLPAWAQKLTKPPEDDGGVLTWIVALGTAVVICVTAFLNPKRSHLN